MQPPTETMQAEGARRTEPAGLLLPAASELPPGGVRQTCRMAAGAGVAGLSYGQWQKFALSRAFFRAADVIVLDEPTASLDPRAEAAVFDRFARLAAGKTALLISHRLGTCRSADPILVLKDGRLAEDGTHDELIALGGEYARMFALQTR